MRWDIPLHPTWRHSVSVVTPETEAVDFEVANRTGGAFAPSEFEGDPRDWVDGSVQNFSALERLSGLY